MKTKNLLTYAIAFVQQSFYQQIDGLMFNKVEMPVSGSKMSIIFLFNFYDTITPSLTHIPL